MSESVVDDKAGESSCLNLEVSDGDFNFGDENLENNIADDDNTEKDGMTVLEVVHQAMPSDSVPKVGMTFNSEDDAYKFYNSYAGRVGFSIKKCHSKHRADGTLSSKYFVCSSEGHKNSNPRQQPVKERASTRTCCNARVQFYVSKDGVWRMQKVILAHNHSFVSPDKTHMLRSQRHMPKPDEHIISKLRQVGVRPTEIYDFFQRWSGGAKNVHFLKMDCNNFIGRERRSYLEGQDAQILLEYLENKQVEDPSFYYAVQLDKEDGRICNFFWADGWAISDYACFGDVISVDTTFQTNKAEMPFAPILGTNHHRQTIVFGAALLFDESAESFVWLFNNFMKAMSGKEPATIFTDQCAAMEKAIKLVFPNSSHRLCIWHIYQNAANNLSQVISRNQDFLEDFKHCVYEERSVAHFNMKWQELLATYDLGQNSWLKNLYSLREKWATVYLQDSFCADMTSTQRSDCMNNVFKKTFRRNLSISELLVEFDKCVRCLRGNELYEDYKSRNSNPVLCIRNLPLLKTAAESYTRNMYTCFEEEFQRQFVLSCALLSHEGTISTFKIMSTECSWDEATVTLDFSDMHVLCSCKKYNCCGILCRHILRVFNHQTITNLPPRYILSRWTKYAKRGTFYNSGQHKCDSLSAESALLSRKMISVALKSSVSEKVFRHLDDGFAKLTLEVENLLSQVNLDENEAAPCFLTCTQEVAEECIQFRVPAHKNGPMHERAKSVLEGGNNNGYSKNRGTNKNAPTNKRKRAAKDPMQSSVAGDPIQSSNIVVDGTLQQTEQINSNVAAIPTPASTSSMVMPFGDNSLF